MIIYETFNLVNGKKYVGQDINNDPKYLGSGNLLRRAIKKYGKESFYKVTIENCSSQKELDEREIFWIKKLDAVNSPEFYNIAEGGQKNKGAVYSKIWTNMVSPDGVIFKEIKNLSLFCREHNLRPKGLRQVAHGERKSHRGWHCLNYKEKYTEESIQYRMGSGNRGKPKTLESNKRRSETLKKTFSQRSPELERIRAQRISKSLKRYFEFQN